jgi:hypothetical protein
MTKLRYLITIFLLVPTLTLGEASNATHFIATNEWQEIKEGLSDNYFP